MILSNQARCLKCGDEPFSRHRHDYASCKCGAIFADGGMDYIRRGGDPHDMTSMDITIPDELGAKVMISINDAISRGCNSRGILCAVAICLRDNGYAIGEVLV